MSPIIQKCLANFQQWQKHRLIRGSFQRLPDALIFDSVSLTTLWTSKNPPAELRRQQIYWSDISEIWVYKKDCFSVDQIRMLLRANHCIIEISEDVEGWQGLMDQLHILLPGSTAWAEWFLKTFHPAYASNVTKIYDRNEKR